MIIQLWKLVHFIVFFFFNPLIYYNIHITFFAMFIYFENINILHNGLLLNIFESLIKNKLLW